jgi:hypothetical protein
VYSVYIEIKLVSGIIYCTFGMYVCSNLLCLDCSTCLHLFNSFRSSNFTVATQTTGMFYIFFFSHLQYVLVCTVERTPPPYQKKTYNKTQPYAMPWTNWIISKSARIISFDSPLKGMSGLKWYKSIYFPLRTALGISMTPHLKMFI